MSNKLFDGSDDDGDDLQITTNKDYAKTYNNLRKKELLQKYKDRGLDVSESEFDSDSSSSEEDEVDPRFDQDFFKTLSSLKSKDPRIYDKGTRFFNESSSDDEENEGESKQKKNKKLKPVTLKDYERKVILEHNGKFESSDEEHQEKEEEEYQRAQSPTAVEEERRLKAEFRNVMNQEDDGEDEEFGGIFKKRSKTKEQTDAEEADFAKWLAGQQDDIQATDKEQLEPLKQYWSSNKLTQGESFLRDYILNKGYANTDASAIPTYDEIVGDNAPLSEDEQELEKQAEFEQKYNFRYEEPDAEFIKRYPRTIEQSVRRTDDKRKEKRKELKERKEQEKQQKMKELDLIKEMKRKEIEEKIRKLKAVTGNDELGFRDDELEEDFDPAAHDRRMQELFNDEYYNVDEGEEKPECPSDIDELALEDWDNYDPSKHKDGQGDDDYDGHCEDDDFNMDCDYDPVAAKQQLQQELIENSRGRKGRKGRRNRFMEMIQAEKPAFDPEDEKTYGEYIDEYYQMDCEDIIGDQPCRFKYVETIPNDFGLTIEEILLAKNKELNQWASLKKAVQTRPEHVEKKEQRLYKMKAKNEDLKRKIFKSLYGEGSDDEEQPEEESPAQVGGETSTQTEAPQAPTEPLSKSKRKRLKRKAAAVAAATSTKTSTEEVKETKEPTDSQESSKNDEGPATKKSKNQDQKPQGPAPKTPNENAKRKNNFKNTKAASAAEGQAPKKAEKGNNPFNKNTNKDSKGTLEGPAKQTQNKFNKKQAESKGIAPSKADKSNGNNPFNKKTNGQSPDQKPLATSFKGRSKQGGDNANPFKKSNQASGTSLPAKKTNNFKAKNRINKNPNGITDDRLKAYGINPRKFHKREKYGKKDS
ncbi:protein KRI1 homolog [Drosophila bipectinata]|uniref:protein KRI1 homolog n=1 Tax=Drosophila bipectinata TaxID=42026 RepID=UPI001C8AA401|nr:protein KRI1 homolog [Drosophila bipectinata]